MSSSWASTPGMDGSRRAGFTAKAKVNRKDWGLDWNVALEAGGWLVGDQVKLDVDIAVQEAGRRRRLTGRRMRRRAPFDQGARIVERPAAGRRRTARRPGPRRTS